MTSRADHRYHVLRLPAITAFGAAPVMVIRDNLGSSRYARQAALWVELWKAIRGQVGWQREALRGWFLRPAH